mgnify:CR=1 FL=1
MPIPRLPPAAAPLDVNLHANVKLRPYFAKFYQDTKLPNDTPEAFLLRVMKRVVIEHYTINGMRTAKDEARAAYDLAIKEIAKAGENIGREGG